MPSLLDVGLRAGQAFGARLFGAAGDLIVGSAAKRGVVLARGTAGQALIADGTNLSYSYERARLVMPTGAFASTMDRPVGPSNTPSILSSGRLSMFAVGLLKGDVVTNIGFISGTTGATSPTNQWVALFDASRNKLAISDNSGTNPAANAAWAASTSRLFTVTSPYTVTTSGLFYLGLCVVATITPTLIGASGTSSLAAGLAPISTGNADSGLTNPASCPSTAAALTVTTNGNTPYAYVT